MNKIPDIKPGDLVKVYTKIIEGDKERLAPFQGVVIKVKGSDIAKTFTVRKVSAGIGIERIFPIHSPMIARIEVKKKGKVRRAKLTYLRQRKGRRMKIREAGFPAAAQEKPGEEAQPASDAEEKTGEGTPGSETVEKV
ncbi:MAG: 50S ribosomal protein L19 [candidate division WOR-3 bacterium]|nr:MAG: 50S ribosomal protein L19 [candidate division WOR-3 bacterium]